MEEIVVATEDLTAGEKSVLFKRMLGVWVVGILMAAFLTYLFFFTGNSNEFDKPSFLLIFPLLFYAVLGFIVYSHTKNAFQKTKSVYTGIITDKRTKTSQINSKSSVRQSYEVCLINTWFNIDQPYYSQVKVGNKVKLHCLDKTVIFKVDVLSDVDNQILHAVKPDASKQQVAKQNFSLLNFMPFNAEDRNIINNKLISAVIYRVILGLALAVGVYFIVFLFFIIGVKTDNLMIYQVFIFGLIAFCALIYLFRNIKTWKLFRDLLDAQKYNVTEEIIDKVSSSNRKPGPNSVVVVNGNTASYSRYFYLQTQSFWLPVSEAKYVATEVGESYTVELAKNSKTVLSVLTESKTQRN